MQGLIYTGSHDNHIRAYSPGSANPLHEFEAHSDTVSCLFVSPTTGTLLSGSWDTTAKVWVDPLKAVMTLKGHEAAVWGAAILPRNGLMVTCGADKRIILWQTGQPKVKLDNAHSQAVRDVAVCSDDTFVSASNDSKLKVWRVAVDGAGKVSANCLRTLETPNDGFLYSMSVLTVGGEDNAWAVGGENSGVMVFKEGEISQVLQIPAISIWKVVELPNGDIAAGCSDGKIWIFSKDPSRKASDDVMVSSNSYIMRRFMVDANFSLYVGHLSRRVVQVSTPCSDRAAGHQPCGYSGAELAARSRQQRRPDKDGQRR